MNGGKLTQEQLASDYSCGIATIRRAKADGVDVQDRDAFAGWVKTKSKRPHAWINGVPWEQPEQQDPHLATDTEHDLMERVRTATNYDTARTLKTQIDSIYRLRQVAILEGDYIHKDQVKNDMTRIGAAVAAALKQCQADLPAMLEGLAAAESKKKISTYMQRIAGMLADEKSKMFK